MNKINSIVWSLKAWNEYAEWQTEDKKVCVKINELIKSIIRDGFNKGLGKPEYLKYAKSWSRRINDEHRLIYDLDSNYNLLIYSCKGHYDD